MRSEDIARLAGVSRSTVSRVINNYSNVPEATREKVLQVIEEHGYEPNNSARVLAGKGLDTIGLFVVSMAERQNANRIYQNNYFAPFVDAVADTANATGNYVLIHSVYAPADFLKVKQAFQQKRIDGGIIVGTEKDIAIVRELAELNAPLVLIDYEIAEITRSRLDRNHLAIINSKDYEGTAEAIRYLISLGHREIGMLCGRMNTFSGRERYEAYAATMQEHGLAIDEAFVLQGEFLKQVAYEATNRMLQSGRCPTALFCANDDMAISAMQALTEHGVRVPEDVSIIGFDDVPVASLLTPRLSSVRLPIYDMARTAVERIVDIREEGAAAFSAISFPTQLMIRESCGAPPEHRPLSSPASS